MSGRARRAATIGMGMAVAIALGACSRGDTPPPPHPPTAITNGARVYAIEQLREAPGVALRVGIDKEKPTVADRIEMVLEARVDPGVRVEWPRIEETLGDFAVVRRVEEPPAVDARGRTGRTLRSERLVLEPFLPGARTIPALEFTCTRMGAAPTALRTEPITIEVVSVLEVGAANAHADPAVMRGVVDLPGARRVTAWALGAGAGATALALVGAGGWMRRRLRREAEMPNPGPVEMARSRLRRLKGVDLSAPGAAAEALAELSDILRCYARGRFGLPPVEATTDQFLGALRDAAPSSVVQTVGELAARMDASKFAGRAFGASEARQVLKSLWELVERTSAGAPGAPPAAVPGGTG